MCWQVRLIWSRSRFSSLSPEFFLIILPFYAKMCARDLSARVMDPAHLDGYFLVRGCPGALKQSMERKTSWFWLCSAGYLWRGSIHPFVLCGQGRCGWEFWEVKDLNQATTQPPKHVGGRRGPPVPLAFFSKYCAPECTYAHTHAHTHTFKYAHTENKQDCKRDSWPLPPPQVLLLTFLFARQAALSQVTYF